MVEHRSPKPGVAGSIPATPARLSGRFFRVKPCNNLLRVEKIEVECLLVKGVGW